MISIFDCTICGKGFSTWSNLCRHNAVHDIDLRHICEHCNYICNRQDNLKRHVQTYHPSNDQKPNFDHLETTQAKQSFTQKKMPGFDKSMMFDKRLQLPNNFVYAGSTQSGKTTLLMKTFENASEIYNPAPSKVVFLYACWQDIYDQLRETLQAQGIKIEFRHEGIVTREDLGVMADPNGGQTMIVVDDNSTTVSENKDVVDAFTKARHNNCSIVLLLHFIFGSQNLAKIRGNTGYYFILKSCENAQHVALLGNKMGVKSALVRAYEQESRKPYGYVLIDRRTITPHQYRIRRNIFEKLLIKPEENMDKEPERTPEHSENNNELPKPPILEKEEPTLPKIERKWLEWNTSKPKRHANAHSKAPSEKKKKPNKKAKTKIELPRSKAIKKKPDVFHKHYKFKSSLFM